jgi:glycosyltransferase involved in cell wall biosynthesis
VVPVAQRMPLYVHGRRRIWPPLAFGLGVLRHLAIHGRRYDVVHTASFPYFSLLAAGLLRRFGRYRLVVDWFEIWSRDYWREYLGRLGVVGFAIQRRCTRIKQDAFCFSRLHKRRLHAEGLAGPVTLLRGLYRGALEPQKPVPPEPLVVFAGRLIPEKRVSAVVPAVAWAREHILDLRCAIFGDGPDRPAVLQDIARDGLQHAVEAPGFVTQERVEAALRSALCVVLPSRREGYGLVVVEAAARSTPTVVVQEPDNAAAEHIEQGVNGFVAPSARPEDLGEAIVRVHRAGFALRERTADWFARNAGTLSLDASLETVLRHYRGGA